MSTASNRINCYRLKILFGPLNFMVANSKKLCVLDDGRDDGQEEPRSRLIRIGQEEYNIPWGATAVLSCSLGGKYLLP